jgi:hypothetical protein
MNITSGPEPPDGLTTEEARLLTIAMQEARRTAMASILDEGRRRATAASLGSPVPTLHVLQSQGERTTLPKASPPLTSPYQTPPPSDQDCQADTRTSHSNLLSMSDCRIEKTLWTVRDHTFHTNDSHWDVRKGCMTSLADKPTQMAKNRRLKNPAAAVAELSHLDLLRELIVVVGKAWFPLHLYPKQREITQIIQNEFIEKVYPTEKQNKIWTGRNHTIGCCRHSLLPKLTKSSSCSKISTNGQPRISVGSDWLDTQSINNRANLR